MSGIGILLTSFVLTAVIGRFLLPLLHKWHFGQSIRECGPKEHLKKNGTPTMGGLMMIAAAIISSLLWILWIPGSWWRCGCSWATASSVSSMTA